MLSFNSLQNFFILNSSLLLLGYVQYNILSIYNNILVIFCIFIGRNYILLNGIDYFTKNKPSISNEIIEFQNDFHIHVITTTAVESITHLFIKNIYFNKNINNNLFSFIWLSFLFEIIFDFFHYFTHRLLHNKYLYIYLHKKHHTFKHPISILAFYQEPLDLFITNSIPTILALLIISYMSYISYLQFNFIIIYKIFIEISGHSGKISYPTCSFPQFIWLPKLLNIELYTEDHDLHHSLNNCNYAKRFSLWDKIFNTYKTKTLSKYNI